MKDEAHHRSFRAHAGKSANVQPPAPRCIPRLVLIGFLDQPIYQNKEAFVGHLEDIGKLVGIHVSGELVCQVRYTILVAPTASTMVPLLHSGVYSAEGHQLFIIVFLQ